MTCRSLSFLASLAIGSAALAQQDENLDQAVKDLERQAERAESDRTVTPGAAATVGNTAAIPMRFAPALLREGSYLTDLVGALKVDPETGAWVFVPETNSTANGGSTADAAPLRLLVLPSTPLEQMQRTVESTDLEVLFRMNARVYAFDNRNYILPIGATQLERYSESKPASDETAQENNNNTEAAGDQSASEIMQSLRQDVPLPRALEAVPEGNGNADAAEGAGGGGRAMIEENTIVVNRRGRIRRNAGGAFVFVFDADSTGLADPPMTLLPCLLLERLQTQFKRGGNEATILISGSVYAYRGRNFLLPTVYRLERANRNINP